MNAPLAPPRWRRIDNFELRIVRRFAALARLRGVRVSAGAVNVLANGWIYAPIAIAVYALAGGDAWSVIGAAALAALVAHLIHGLLKRSLRRPRPFERDPSLVSRTRVLDRYSFPSGHCMTLVCVAVPIVYGAHWLWPFAALYVALLAVCRLIAAHHYPTDVFAGSLIGLSVGWAASVVVFVN
jgi:undecaprenyl-diphosphatase